MVVYVKLFFEFLFIGGGKIEYVFKKVQHLYCASFYFVNADIWGYKY